MKWRADTFFWGGGGVADILDGAGDGLTERVTVSKDQRK